MSGNRIIINAGRIFVFHPLKLELSSICIFSL